jgi:hypothetical protein
MLSGQVNGQPGFILKGTPKRGAFESAYSKGKIECEKPQNADYLVMFRPEQNYFTVDQPLAAGLRTTRVDTSSLHHGLICFIGSAQAFAAAVQSRENYNSSVLSPSAVEFTYDYRFCSKPTGTHEDDSGCDEYTTIRETKQVPNCFKTDTTESQS